MKAVLQLPKLCWVLLAPWVYGLLVFSAILVLFLRLMWSTLEGNEQIVYGYVEEFFGIQVASQNLATSWSTNPILKLDSLEVRAGDSAQSAIQIAHTDFSLAFIPSILAARPIIENISVHGARFRFEQLDSGGWQLAGFQSGGQNSVKWRQIRTFMSDVGRGSLSDVHLEFLSISGESRSIGPLDVTLQTVAGDRQLSAQYSRASDGHLLNIQYFRHFTLLGDTEQKGYIHLRLPDLGQWLSYLGVNAIGSGVLETELWFDSSAESSKLRGFFDAREVAFSLPWAIKENLETAHVSASFAATPMVEGLKGGFADIEVTVGDQQLHLPILSAVIDKNVGMAYIPTLNLAELNTFITPLLPLKSRPVMQGLSLRGVANNIVLDWMRKSQPTISVDLESVGVDSWKGVPSIFVEKATLKSNLSHSVVRLDKTAFKLGLPKIFAKPVRLDELSGDVYVGLGKSAAFVDASHLEIDSALGAAAADVALYLPYKKDALISPKIDLHLGLVEGSLSDAKSLLPINLPPTLLTFLDRGIQQGDIKKAALAYSGDLVKGLKRSQMVQLYLDLFDTDFVFDEHWMPIENAQGQFILNDRDIAVSLSSASILDANVSNIQLVGESVDNAMKLNIRGALNGNSHNAVRLFTETPLADITGNAFEGWEADGDLQAEIELEFTTNAMEKMLVAVDASISSTTLQQSALRLSFNDVEGDLRYSTSAGLAANQLSVKFFDELFSGSMSTTLGERQGQVARLNLKGDIAARSLEEWLRQPLFQELEGSTTINASLSFGLNKQASHAPQLNLSSEMLGIRSMLPAPFDKDINDSWPLALHLVLADSNQALSL